MAKFNIDTRDQTRDFGEEYKETTGTDFTGSVKRAIDVVEIGGAQLSELIDLALVGCQPAPNYDTVVVSRVSASALRYTFTLGGVDQFIINVTNIDTGYPTAAVTMLSGIVQEDGGQLLTEGGDNLVLESGN